MPANPDFADLFRTFNASEVRYLVVGAYAVAYHGHPRYTKDLDIWVEPTAQNASRVYQSLAEFGAPMVGVTPADFMDPHLVYQIGIEPNRIDVLMGLGDLPFDACFQRASPSTYAGYAIRILSLDDLISAKRSCGRPQDLLDVERLSRNKQPS